MATVFTFNSESELEFFLNNATLPSQVGIIAKGAKFSLGGLDGPIVSPEAQAVLDRITGAGGTLTQTEEDAIAAFVDREVTAARWPTVAGGASSGLIDEFMFLGFQDALASDVGWLLSVATNTDVTHVPGVGKSYNGTTSFSDTKYTPGFSGVNYLQDDALLGGFVNLFSIDSGFENIFGNFATGIPAGASIDSRAAQIGYAVNQASGRLFGSSIIKNESLYTAVRSSSNGILFFENGVSIDTFTEISSAIPTLSFFIGARNLDGVADAFSTTTVSSFIAGATVGFDQLEHFNSFEQFLIDVGTLP